MELRGGNIAIRLAVTLGFLAVTVAAAFWGTHDAPSLTASAQNVPPVGQNYSNFSHRSYSHSQLSCASCHQRGDNSATPRFPGHNSCTNCHLAQFVNPQAPMCGLCHSSLASMPPPMKAFPAKFGESFNVKFDHAQHNQGAARPANGCASCHSAVARRGAAMSIPAGIGTHTTCYQCHTPGATSAGRDISNCAACHSTAAFRRTSTNSTAFNVGFSHATHGPRQRLNCADCHTLSAGRPQGLQVSSPRPVEHSTQRASSCATCHNGKRAFGELTDCKRCHTGATFSFRGR